jgi:hypothetical protein
MIYTLKGLLDTATSTSTEINGKWVPCRPMRFTLKHRIKAAWLVLTDKADAVIWPEGH